MSELVVGFAISTEEQDLTNITRSDPRGRLGAVMGCPPGGPSRLPVAIMPTLEEVVAWVVEGSPAG